MQGQQRERWLQLCEQAAAEQDPARLLALVEEINRLLAEKEKRINQQRNCGLSEPRNESPH
jgi:hypothetical protein